MDYSVKVMNRSELLKQLGICKRTFDSLEALGQGPRKTQLSPRRIGYRVSDVVEWLNSRAQRRAA
jgi:predicted DNA-binding transcriptional regulator AlpA